MIHLHQLRPNIKNVFQDALVVKESENLMLPTMKSAALVLVKVTDALITSQSILTYSELAQTTEHARDGPTCPVDI